MKKITLFLICFIFIPIAILAQDFQNENFEGLPIGNVGTDPNGTITGQGGFQTYTTTGQNSDFQIVNVGGSYGKALQITGPTNDTDVLLTWKNGLDTSWGSRTTGNDILELEFDLFSGPTTTSKNLSLIQIYDLDYTTIVGFAYIPETKYLLGLIYINNGSIDDTYPIDLGNNDEAIILSPDTWYKMGVAFNKTTGEVTYKGPGFSWKIQGAAAGKNPFDYDFVVIGDTGDPTSFNFKFDNLRISAVDTEGLLGIDDLGNLVTDSIKLYPNPARDVINLKVSSHLNISKLEILDLNGRLINSLTINNVSIKEINISDLQKGLYLLNIYSSTGMITKKIIKE